MKMNAEEAAERAKAPKSIVKKEVKAANDTKGKGAKKGDWGMPLDLRGLNRKDKSGNPLCFGYNLPNGCEEAAPGKACRKGLHVCAKCLQEHSYQGCTVKSE